MQEQAPEERRMAPINVLLILHAVVSCFHLQAELGYAVLLAISDSSERVRCCVLRQGHESKIVEKGRH